MTIDVLVFDEGDMIDIIREALGPEYVVHNGQHFGTQRAGTRIIEQQDQYDCIVVDLHVAGAASAAYYSAIIEDVFVGTSIPIIVTYIRDEQTAMVNTKLRKGTYNTFMQKPYRLAEMKKEIERLTKRD